MAVRSPLKTVNCPQYTRGSLAFRVDISSSISETIVHIVFKKEDAVISEPASRKEHPVVGGLVPTLERNIDDGLSTACNSN